MPPNSFLSRIVKSERVSGPQIGGAADQRGIPGMQQMNVKEVPLRSAERRVLTRGAARGAPRNRNRKSEHRSIHRSHTFDKTLGTPPYGLPTAETLSL